MKKNLYNTVLLATMLLLSANIQAQSLKEIFSKDNMSKTMSGITGHKGGVILEGKWQYESSAVELHSSNILKKAGAVAAEPTAEKELNAQLAKIGIQEGKLSFTFNSDSTFTHELNGHKASGKYRYDYANKQIVLTYLKIINLNAKVNYYNDKIELLFNSDLLLKLLTFIGSKSDDFSIKAVSNLAKGYDGMMLGFKLKK